MIKWILISAASFTFGNIIWNKIPSGNDDRFFYIPLSVMILLMLIEIKSRYKNEKYPIPLLIKYFVILASGNVIKQTFYTPEIKQINDYYWGALVTLWLIGSLIGFNKWILKTKLLKWVNHKLNMRSDNS